MRIKDRGLIFGGPIWLSGGLWGPLGTGISGDLRGPPEKEGGQRAPACDAKRRKRTNGEDTAQGRTNEAAEEEGTS